MKLKTTFSLPIQGAAIERSCVKSLLLLLVCVLAQGCLGSVASDAASEAEDLRRRHCGDGICQSYESCSSCARDCGQCPAPNAHDITPVASLDLAPAIAVDPAMPPTPIPASTSTDTGQSITPTVCNGNCVYVRAGASGNGSDWNSALPAIPSTLVRGNTYFVASGAYGSHSFSPLAGTSYVYIKKATTGDHGTDTGWQSPYGTGQAVFSSSSWVFVVHMAYLSIDGATGSITSGYGIKLTTTGTGQGSGATIYSYSVAPDYLLLKHLELEAPQPNGNLSNFNLDSHVWPGANGEVISYCYIHGGLVGVLFTGSNETIEHSYLQNNGGQGHSEMIDASNVQNLTIRYNTLENMVAPNGTTYIEPQVNGGAIPNGIYIYGNVFKATRTDEQTNNPSVFSSTSGEKVLNVFIYNNTIYGLHGSSPTIGMADTGVRGDNANSTVTVRNNLWQDCTYNPSFQSVMVQDHNILNTGGVSFVDAPGGDFHLTAPTSAGGPLPSPFNLDPDGKVRGSDGNWDIGAHELTN